MVVMGCLDDMATRSFESGREHGSAVQPCWSAAPIRKVCAALHNAATVGNAPTVQVLLDDAANPNSRNGSGHTQLCGFLYK